MKRIQVKRLALSLILLLGLLTATGCEHDFYLSENEARAYQSVLSNQANANLYFDNLQGRSLDFQFDNSTGTPQLLSSNLGTEIRRT